MTTEPDQRDLVREAKAIVALAFRNGPIEDLHAGKPCTACEGKAGYSRISDAEMKVIMKNAVNHVYSCSGSRLTTRRAMNARLPMENGAP